jgi:hypothetical protein
MGNKSTNVTSTDFNPKEWIITDRELSENQSKGIIFVHSGNYHVL